MSSLLFVTIIFIVYVKGCMPPLPMADQTYISNVQLLSTGTHPDSVLLTIYRSSGQYLFNTEPRLNYVNNGPWCKIMNIKNGSVSDTVDCSNFKTREYATRDIDPKSTSISCTDNCDGASATCDITRDNIVYSIANIPYLESSTTCNSALKTPILGISSSFTINDISTTYIMFSTNLIGIEFDDTVFPVGYKIYNVERKGDWSYLHPGEYYFYTGNPSIYSAANVMEIPLPCCICYSSRLATYSIVTDTAQMSQIFTLTSLGNGGGGVDVIKQRVINRGLFYSKAVTVYDLVNEGKASVFRPNLCDMLVYCFLPPCSVSGRSCPYNNHARCVNDYCGGCNARWFCGTSDVTSYCDSGYTSNQLCPYEQMPGGITVL